MVAGVKERAVKNINMRVTPGWLARLRKQSKARGVKLSRYIRRAVEDQLARDEMYQSSRGK